MISIVLCSLSAAAMLYVVAFYPLLLALMARRRGRPTPVRENAWPSVSIIIPVYNGETFLAEKLRSVLLLEYPRERMEVFVVSDGSTDDTESIARSYATEGVRLIQLARGGKPAALNAAIPAASGEVLVLTDVRQTLSPDSLRFLVESFADPSVGVVSGELLIRKGSTEQEADIGLYWRYESMIRNNLSRLDSMFGATGPFYAIRRELAVPIPPDILLDDMYLPMSAFFRGYRLVVDRRARAFDYPTSRDTEFRRKVRTLAGNYQLMAAMPRLLGPGNRMWFHFVSYKAGRLLLPWLLVVFAVSSCGLPGLWHFAVPALQGAAYGLAAADPLVPTRNKAKKITSPLRTFLVMMAAALAGLSVFFVPARSLWKVTSASPVNASTER
jgi:cellulose synthase/poly-beta-1,6-N-acetylglucosamine synthase-like glycosyltransferase